MMPEPELPSTVVIHKGAGFDSPSAGNGARADADLHGDVNGESNFENGASVGVKDQQNLHSNAVLDGGTVATDLNGDLYENGHSAADNGGCVVAEDGEGRPAVGGFDNENGSHVEELGAKKESRVDFGEDGLSTNYDSGAKDMLPKLMIGQPDISETSNSLTIPSDGSDTQGKCSSLQETGMESECNGNSIDDDHKHLSTEVSAPVEDDIKVREPNAESETRYHVVEADHSHNNADTSTLAEDETMVKGLDLKSKSEEVAVEDDNEHVITEVSAPADDDTQDGKLNLESEQSDGVVEGNECIITEASKPSEDDTEESKLNPENEHSDGILEGNERIITEASAPVEDDTEDGKLNLESEHSDGILEGNERIITESSAPVEDHTEGGKLNPENEHSDGILERNEHIITEASAPVEDETEDGKLNLESEHSDGILEGNERIITEASAPVKDHTEDGKLNLKSEHSDGIVEGNERIITEASVPVEDGTEDGKLNLENGLSDGIIEGNERITTEASALAEDDTEDGKLNLESEHSNGIVEGNEHITTEASVPAEDDTEVGKSNLELEHSDGIVEGNEHITAEASAPAEDDTEVGKSNLEIEHSDGIVEGNGCIITEASVPVDDDSEAGKLNLESEHCDGDVEDNERVMTEASAPADDDTEVGKMNLESEHSDDIVEGNEHIITEAAGDDTAVGKLNLESERSDGIVEADNSYDSINSSSTAEDDVRVSGLDVNTESRKDVMEDDSEDKREDLVLENESRENIVEVDEEHQSVEVSKSAEDGIEVGELDFQSKSSMEVILEDNTTEDGNEHKGAQASISAEDDPKTLVVRDEGTENLVEADYKEHQSPEVFDSAGDLDQNSSSRESSTKDDNDDKRVEDFAPAENDTGDRQLDVEMSVTDNTSTQSRDSIVEANDASSYSKTEATCQDSGVNPVLKKVLEPVEYSGEENVPLTSEPEPGKLSTVSSGDTLVAQLNFLASTSKEHYVHNAEHTVNVSIRFGSFDVGDTEKQVEDTLAGDQNPSSEESKNVKYYLMKIPRNHDEDLEEKTRKAQIRVHETTQSRDAIQNEIQRKKAICMEYLDNVHATESQERDARGLYRSKCHEVDSLQSVIDLGNIDSKIRNMEHKIQHETLPLKEEKLLIREINLLKQEHKQLQSHMSRQEEVEQAVNEEANIDGRLQHLRKELDALWNNLLKAETAAKAAKKKHFEESKKLDNLREEFNAANAIRQNAYKHFQSLKEQSHEKNKYFWQYRDDSKTAQGFAYRKDRKALQHHCASQVERFMNLWNKGEEFRREYAISNTRRTVRSSRTIDGCSTGPSEETLVLPHLVDGRSKDKAFPPLEKKPEEQVTVYSCSVGPSEDGSVTPHVVNERRGRDKSVSTLEKKQLVLGEAEKSNDMHVAKISDLKSQPSKSRKLADVNALSREDELEEARKVEQKRKVKEEEMVRKAEEVKKEEEAIRLKEQRRLEENAKARDAMERKRRLAEKAQARAAAKAKKEAEQREKEREKKQRKKEQSKATAVDGASVNDQKEICLTEKNTTEINQESETLEKPSKRSTKPSHFTKQTKISSIPPPLRSRRRRRMQPWMWVLIVILLLVLFALWQLAATWEAAYV